MDTAEFVARHPTPERSGIDLLYKFTRFDLNRLADLLVRKRLYFARPAEFNDPWEARPWIQVDQMAERERWVNLLIQEGYSERDAHEKVAEKTPQEVFEISTGAMNQFFDKTLVCSLTTQKGHPLLWSHYADGHRGLCLGFDTKNSPFRLALKVSYQDRYPTRHHPIIDPMQRGFEDRSILATKSKVWSYEDEYRVVDHPLSEIRVGEFDGQCAILPDDALTDVYFGVGMCEDHRWCIREMIKRGPFQPRIYEAKISKTSYSLSFDEVE